MVHILMSTYNGARYLAQQIDSILAQTYTEWRLYIRDDGSSDNTLRIAKDYANKDKRITIMEDSDNLGACRSFERLLQVCDEATYYAFADQDDVWKPNKIALCVEAMYQAEQTHPNCPIVVHTDLQVVDENLSEIASSFWQYSNIRPDIVDVNPRYLAIGNSVTGCAMLFNHAARIASIPFPKTAYMHDAWVALITAAQGGKVIPLFITPIAYRQHSHNVLGAVRYTLLHKKWKQRKDDARRCYSMAHPLVYTNKVQFLFWKMVYFIHRQCS